MKKTTVGLLGAALLLGLAAAPQAFAQEEGSKHPMRISIFFGGTTASDTEITFTIDPAEPNGVSTKFDDGSRFGIRGTYDITNRIAAEGMWGTGARSLLVRDNPPFRDPARFRTFEVDQQDIYGNLLIFFNDPDQAVRPFVTGGVGITDFSPTAFSIAKAIDPAGDGFIDQEIVITSESNLGYNFGFGVESNAGEHFGFRADLRDYITSAPVFGVPTVDPLDGTDFYPISGSISYWVATLGIVIRF